MNRIIKSLAACVIGVVALGAAGGFYLYKSGFTVKDRVAIYIDTDDNIDSVRHKIESTTEPQSMMAFDVFAKVFSLSDHIRTGKYEVTSDLSMLKLIRHIRNHNETPVKLVVPSVRTIQDMAGRLADHLMLDSATIANRLIDNAQLQSLGYTVEKVPALFVPNTYEVYWDISIDEFIARMQKENDAFWTKERMAKLAEVSEYAGREMNKIDVVTLASIVDSETANNAEKPNIAGLYLNRLRINMPLQSDPTVKFALADFALRRILKAHLSVDSPFNTYKNTGLPPGPICIPSVAGIDAVLNHASHNYIYMCAKEDFSGTHNFAESYSEHLKNAARYTLALNQRKIFK